MRILVVSTAFPVGPPVKVHGVYQRLHLFVDALKEIADLHFLFFVDSSVETSNPSGRRYREILAEHWGSEIELTLQVRERDARTRWEFYGQGVFDAFRQPGLRWATGPRQRQAFERALEKAPDSVFVHRLATMPPVLRTRRSLPPVYFDLDDIEHVALRRSIPQPPVWWAKRLRYLHVPSLWRAERRAISRAHRTFVCSERDRDYLSRTMRVSGVEVVPNAVRLNEPAPPPETPTLLFLGSYAHPPNRNAASRLLREIWPRVRRQVPNARLVIAGPHPELVPRPSELGSEVEFPGFVEDLNALYGRTRVVCAPICSGSGTRIKILEAAAFARPIVSSSVGVDGLDFRDGHHILVRDDPDGMAAAIVDLINDDDRCRTLGLAAHDVVRRLYARDRVVRSIRDLFRP